MKNKVFLCILVLALILLITSCKETDNKIESDSDAYVEEKVEDNAPLNVEPSQGDKESELVHENEILPTEPETPTEDNETKDDNDENFVVSHINVSDIKLTLYEISLYVGETRMPIVTMYPQTATDKSEIWSSSDEGVATVNTIGEITGVSHGSCTITVASRDNPDVFATVNVKVVPDVECTYIDGILIVNKTHPLPRSYAPGWETEATPHLWEMIAAAKADGIKLWVSSGYRSYYDQQYIYNGYVARDGQEEADRYSARPGHSEHQSGLAYDLNDLSHDFGETPEGIWVAENCHKFGFIIRYPQDKEDITGYIYEPWHIRYLGVEKATEVYESGLCLEEFLGITSVYT